VVSSRKGNLNPTQPKDKKKTETKGKKHAKNTKNTNSGGDRSV
jgi:hypothetical protein